MNKRKLMKNAITAMLMLCSLIALSAIHEDAKLSTNLICAIIALTFNNSLNTCAKLKTIITDMYADKQSAIDQIEKARKEKLGTYIY